MNPKYWVLFHKAVIVISIIAMANCALEGHPLAHGLALALGVAMNLYMLKLWSSVNE